ncbi:hypothetical protein U9M48_014408 [Paspalum notatum var. saurae]|uniref:Uncharacterized protein n=1 Tax=Paspalum notatum var. saurae TaxID=547442 RepID=A0AAQ3T1M8_PASNO
MRCATARIPANEMPMLVLSVPQNPLAAYEFLIWCVIGYMISQHKASVLLIDRSSHVVMGRVGDAKQP